MRVVTNGSDGFMIFELVLRWSQKRCISKGKMCSGTEREWIDIGRPDELT
jgi:hypothetical protein